MLESSVSTTNHHVLDRFDQLLAQSRTRLPLTEASSSSQQTKKSMEAYTSSEAREVLLRLLQRGASSCSRKNWKAEETGYLVFVAELLAEMRGVTASGLSAEDWEEVGKLVPGRSGVSCQFRYLAMFSSTVSRVPWSSYERQLLLDVISRQDSTVNWKTVAQQLYAASQEKVFRTGKQCRQHYSCFLKPNLRKGCWKDSEDYLLVCLFLKFGKKWSRMARFIEGRNENAIKNRFFLMFENKKDMRITNSDLLKLARRRKLKLERKMVPNPLPTNQNEMNVAPQNQQASGLEGVAMRFSSFRSEIFMEEGEKGELNMEDCSISSCDQFQKYIDLS